MKLQNWLLILLAAAASAAVGGGLDAPGAPSGGSGMPSTADIYGRLDSGAAITPAGAFREPAAGPAPTGRTLAEIAAKLPTPDDTNGATTGEVATGRTFWGLRTDGTWGPAAGAALAGADITGPDGALSISIPDGFYTGGKTATTTDGDLAPGNIRTGITIFGVAGTLTPATGNADASNVLAGRVFSNGSGTGIVGTMADNGAVAITPGANAQTIPAGYHNGAGSVAGDADLTTGNIRSGTAIFGVTGTLTPPSGDADAAHVLAGKTFSNASATGIAGAMPDNGAVAITPGTVAQAIPAGFHSGAGSVAGDANLAAGNIRSGVSIFGVTGTLAPGVDVSHFATFSCSGRWTGPTCEACIGNWAAPTCEACISNWGGPNCDTCAPNFTGAQCDTCNGNWTGVSCDTCIAGWSGANCEVNCPVNGWSGSNCDIIAKPFPATPPSYASTPWKCVYDSATGLTWEVKTTDGGLHDKNATYQWGGATDAFVAAVNAEQLCGYADWRLPTKEELAGLVVLGPRPTIDTGYFPNTNPYNYWSGSMTLAGGLVWYVFFWDGTSSFQSPSYPAWVRLVRSGP